MHAAQTEFVSDVASVVTVGQEVTAWVVSVDEEKKRFGLSLKKPEEQAASADAKAARVATRATLKPRDKDASEPAKTLTAKRGDWVEGTVQTVLGFGAIVEVEDGIAGLLHISEMSGAR